jgi:hypothetical protein
MQHVDSCKSLNIREWIMGKMKNTVCSHDDVDDWLIMCSVKSKRRQFD